MSKDYLNVKWQKKRLEILNRDEFTCRECGVGEEDEITLHVHHLWYAPNQKPWDYPDTALKTLCSKCHEEAHYLLSEGQSHDLHRMFCQCGLTPQQIGQFMNTLSRVMDSNQTLDEIDLYAVHRLLAARFNWPLLTSGVDLDDLFVDLEGGK